MAEITPNYVVFTVISAIVAAAGLLADSAAVVVGSMVIAPLLGPAVGASVGSIVNDDDLFRTGAKAQVLGLAVLSVTVFAFFAKFTFLLNIGIRSLAEVASRVNPGALSLVVALGSGAAGALSLTAGVSAPLVGVMIAAALIPPAAAVGLGVAYGDAVLVVSSSVLVLVNVPRSTSRAWAFSGYAATAPTTGSNGRRPAEQPCDASVSSSSVSRCSRRFSLSPRSTSRRTPASSRRSNRPPRRVRFESCR